MRALRLRAAGLALLAALAFLVGCGAGDRGPAWLALAPDAWSADAWAGRSHPVGEQAFTFEARGPDLWLATDLSRDRWRREAPGLYWTQHPAHAIGRPQADGASYELELAGDGLEQAGSLEALKQEPRGFAVEDLRLWLRLEGEERAPDALRFRSLANHERAGAQGRRLTGRRFHGAGFSLMDGVRRTVTADVPPASVLHFTSVTETAHYTADERRGERVFRLWLEGAPLYEFTQVPARQGDSVQHHSVPLPRGGGRGVELTFQAEGPFGFAGVLNARLGPAERGAYGSRPWGRVRPDLVVFLADTFRADNVTAYGGELALTPAIDAFGDEARVFLEARSVGTHTLSTHSTMFSGFFPHQNGQVDFWNPLPFTVETVAEVLARNGYRCGAVTDGVLVSASHGLDQGFEHFDELQESLDSTLERARKFLAADDGRPVFLFVQTYAVHAPYHVSAETRASHGERLDFSRGFAELIGGMRELELGSNHPDLDVPGTRERIAGLEALYRGAVVDLDRAFGRFLVDFDTVGPGRSGYLLFTSDHGEAFAEHGQLFHAGTTYEEQIRVPLILRGPGLEPGRVTTPASLIDFAPTLLSLAGLPKPDLWPGSTLTNLPGARTLFAFQSRETAPVSSLAILEEGHKLIGVEDVEGRRMGELLGAFDLGQDPGEQQDLRAEARWPAELESRHEGLLELFMTPLVGAEAAHLTPEKIREMEGAGYFGEARRKDR